jgi:DNA-binding CsgD family transcriptional regulator
MNGDTAIPSTAADSEQARSREKALTPRAARWPASPARGGRARLLLDLLPHPCALFDRAVSGKLLEANTLFYTVFCEEHRIESLPEFEACFEGSPKLGPNARNSRRNNNHRSAGIGTGRTVRDKLGRWHLISHRLVWGPLVGKSLLLLAHDVTPMMELPQAITGAESSGTPNWYLARLSSRERQVMEQVIAGKLTKTIADELGISIKTVEMHRSNIMRKLGARNVADLVRLTMHGGSQTSF